MFRVNFQRWDKSGRANEFVRRVTGRSPWVWMTVLLIGVMPFAIVAALLAIGALLVCAALYTALSAIDRVFQAILGGGAPRPEADHDDAGRENVRVIPPEQR